MKKFAVTVMALAVAVLIALPKAAYAWPAPIEIFGEALNKGDVQAALSVFTDDAVVVLPSALLSPRFKLDSQLRGNTPDSHALRLAGKKQISIWLDEFLIQGHGVLVMNGPAEMHGDAVTTSYATYWDDNTRRIVQSGVSAEVEVSLQGDKIKGFWLKLPGEPLTKLEAANTQAALQNPPGGDKQNAENTVPKGTPKSAIDTLGAYAWLGVPAGLVVLAAFGLWLPRRRFYSGA